MRSGRLEKPPIPDVQSSQDIFLDKSVKFKPDTQIAEKQITVEQAKNLIASLLSDFEGTNNSTSYAQILNDNISKPVTRSYDPDKVLALRESNRARLADLKDKFNKLLVQLDKRIKEMDYTLSYDIENPAHKSVMDFYFPNHTPGIANTEQMDEVKSKVEALNQIKADANMNLFYKKADKPDKRIPIEEKWASVREEAIRFLMSNAKNPSIEEIKGIYSIAADVEKLQDSQFGAYLDSITVHWESEEQFVSDKNMGQSIGLLPIRNATKEATRSISYVESTLNGIDEQNSYIDTLFKNKEPVNLSVKGRKFTFPIEDVLENCFDCFLNGGWPDFGGIKLGIDLEYDISKVIDKFEFLFKKISLALDVEYLIKQNYCSLAAIGSLCPIELTFILANLIALTRFTWSGLVKFNGGVLFSLMAMILDPLLNALKLSLRFSYSPFTIYAGCTSKSLVKLSDVSKALPNPTSGWTFKEIADAERGVLSREENQNNERTNNLINKMSEQLKDLSTFDKAEFSKIVGGLRESANADPDPNIFKDLITGIFTTPFLADNSDLAGVFDIAIKETGSFLESNFLGVSNAIKALSNLVQTNMVSKVEIGAKLMALSSLIALVGALVELGINGIQPCIPLPIYDKDGNQIGTVLETPFSPSELQDLIDNTDFNNPKSSDVIDNQIGLNSLGSEETRDPGVLYNPLTDRRFNLTACNKAKSSIISKGETLDFWKKIALGVNIDNV